MSDKSDAKPAKAKGGMMGKLLPLLAFVAGAGAGGAGAAIAVLQFAPKGGGEAHAPAAPPPPAPVEYLELDNAFTSNLVDTGRYLQVRLSLSTFGGPAAVAAIEKHKPAVVSAVLAVLGDLGEADIADQAAKEKLRAKLKEAVNAALKGRGEPFTVEEVFFISLVVQ